MAVVSPLLLLALAPAVTAPPCTGFDSLSLGEADRCAWEQDVRTCMATSCHGISGDPYLVCERDTEKIQDCCQQHHHSGASPPDMCESAAIAEAVKACAQADCQGCSGDACKLCREDSARVAACCAQQNVSHPPQICQCAGLQGDALGSCQWEQAVTFCLWRKCGCAHASSGWIGDTSSSCDLCQAMETLPCCEETQREASEPETYRCFQQAVTETIECVERKCRSCRDENCRQYWCESAKAYTDYCCNIGFTPAKVCEAAQEQGRQRREILP
mmetsp:Transcript_46257/g.95615  ORF Transcript_46257/g.95615 Transcript_46257/m.95615 type:complete len:273 (-) Transcript_46257:203-1021(-)